MWGVVEVESTKQVSERGEFLNLQEVHFLCCVRHSK